MSTQTSTPTSSNFINLHTTGIGYMTRVREVPVRKGQPFMSAMIRAMHGEKGVQDGIQYVPFDVKAVTDETKEVLQHLAPYTNSQDYRVMVQFKIGDFYIDTFKYPSGPKAGETGTMMKGRLVQIYAAWVKKTGTGSDQMGWTEFYRRPAKEAQALPDQQVEELAVANGYEG